MNMPLLAFLIATSCVACSVSQQILKLGTAVNDQYFAEGVDITPSATMESLESADRTAEKQILFSITFLPGFIADIKQSVNSIYPEEMCVYLDESNLWEEGNYAEDLQDHLQNTVILSIDGQNVEQDNYYSVSGLTINVVLDEDDKPIGTYSDITYCLNVGELVSGLHTARIKVTTLSGVRHSYSWEFEIVEQQATPVS